MKQAGVDSGACGYEQYSVYRWLGDNDFSESFEKLVFNKLILKGA